MLVLSRRQGEIIRIGDDICVMYLGQNEVWTQQAKIGIIAPAEMSIHREEVYKAIKQGVPYRYTNR